MAKRFPQLTMGLYRDVRLGHYLRNTLSGPQLERLKKDVIAFFKDKGQAITIEFRLHKVDFLDMTFDLPNASKLSFNQGAADFAQAAMVNLRPKYGERFCHNIKNWHHTPEPIMTPRAFGMRCVFQPFSNLKRKKIFRFPCVLRQNPYFVLISQQQEAHTQQQQMVC